MNKRRELTRTIATHEKLWKIPLAKEKLLYL
jgi:hypothetical protein